jgi:exopolyphosphatase/guanosine-5'-triphosphate,3'-diphosphate pyrophosphatase
MKVAVIDVGSNSIRLLTGKLENQQLSESQKVLTMTRLGKGINATKQLAEDRMAESIDVIDRYKQNAKAFGADSIFIMATSAVRDATNRAEFLERVKERTGLDIAVLSGDLEADIGYLGVQKGLNKKIEELLVLDIGGGSTELILGEYANIVGKFSHNIGAVRMTDLFFEKAPVDTAMEQLRDFVKRALDERKDDFYANDKRCLVGIGGTITTFAAMAQKMKTYERQLIHNYELPLKKIEIMTHNLSLLSPEERENTVGLDPKRSDIIVAGGVILCEMMRYYGYNRIVISDFDNLEGYLYYCLKEQD